MATAAEPRPADVDTIAVDPGELRTWILRAGIPPRHAGARFELLEERQGTARAVKAARRSAIESRGLVLIGPFGTGKTTLGACIVAERARRWLAAYPREIVSEGSEGILTRPRFGARFVAVPELLDAIRRSYEYHDGADPLRIPRDVPLLVLDDLGRERATEWVLERLYVLIEHRYSHQLPTVVTTNFSLDELSASGYGAMVSRLVEGVDVVEITASDARRER